MAGQRFNSGRVSDWGHNVVTDGALTASRGAVLTANPDVPNGVEYGFTPPLQLPPIAGKYLPRLNLASSHAGGTCGSYQEMRVNFIPVSRPCTLSELTVSVYAQAATAGTVVRFGIYAYKANGDIGDLVIDLGTVDVTSTGLKTIDFSATPVSVTNGGFFFANVWQAQNSSFHLRSYEAGGAGGQVGYFFASPMASQTRAVSVMGSNLFVASTTGALPTSPTWSEGNTTPIPLHNWKVLSVP